MITTIPIDEDDLSVFDLISYYTFDRFNPLSGDIAPLRIPIFTNIVFRARQLIRHRTIEQLEYALLSLNWMLTQINKTAINPIIQMLIELDARQGQGEEIGKNDYTFPTEVNTLTRCMETFDIEGQELLPNVEWYEYFAILALAKVGLAFDFNADQTSNDPADEQFLIYAAGFAVEAMEAIRSAEMHKEAEIVMTNLKTTISNDIKEKVSLRNKNASIKRHEKTYLLYRELETFYDAGGYKSYKEATQDFLKSIPDERVQHLAPTNRLRTLSEALSAIKRGKRAP